MTVPAFTCGSLRFDHEPADLELTALLGSSDDSGWLTIRDTPDELVVSPQLVPMKFAALFSLFLGIVISIVIFSIHRSRGGGPMLPAMLLIIWLLIFPLLLGLVGFINGHFRKIGDYFRIEKKAGILNLRQAGRSVLSREIVCFVLLDRYFYFSGNGGWNHVMQLSVLAGNTDGTCELFPLAKRYNILWPPWTIPATVSEFFGKPVRRITLDKKRSKALGDRPG